MLDMAELAKSQATLVFGQMNEPPGARARVALSGLTVAEYFPDPEITGFHDPAVNFELRFQAAEDPDGPDPHDEAENDEPPIATPVEDGSNVVAVDFKRKK